MSLRCNLFLLWMLVFVSSFPINKRWSQISHALYPHAFPPVGCSLKGREDTISCSQASSPVLLDASSIISSSNYPWTLEALLSTASLMRESEEIAIIVLVESDSDVLFFQGPLASRVGLWFANATAIQQIPKNSDNQFRYVSSGTSLQSLSPDAFLSDIESLGPRTQLNFPNEPSKTIKSLLDAQAEIQTLRDILNPTKRRSSSSNVRKGVSRQKRMQTAKWGSTRSAKSARPNQPYNITQEASILRQKLIECDSCQVDNVKDGLMQVISTLNSQAIEGNTDFEYRNVDGQRLSDQVLTIPRRSNISTSLRMVVISDTHGFEKQFYKFGNNSESKSFVRMPDADMLIHCGDFDGGADSLNAFLAAQTHIPHHFVVRGNHDPKQYSIPKGHFITKPQTFTLNDGTKLEARPFSRSQNPQPVLPIDCDILMTHEPPFEICDRTYRTEHVGSMTLRHAVESSLNPPALWLCGHIHEGRGAVWHSFGSEISTLVVNAANANSGKAKRITTGPVVIELVPKIQKKDK
jgi:predicted phosphodiesterase